MTTDRTLSTSRVLPFPPPQVFRAFSSPETLETWWGPEGFSNTFETCEFVPGGRWKFVMHAPDGVDYENESVFEEIVADEKIVILHDCAPKFRLTIDLEPQGEETQVTWTQVFEDARTAEAVRAMVGSANEQNLDRLTAALSRGPASTG